MTVLGGRWGSAPSGPDAAAHDEAAFWADLARRVAQGDQDAEADLARRFHARVRIIASVRLHGSDAAVDIAQDTLLAVIEALRAGKLRDSSRLPGFVLAVARNLINNHLRAQARSVEVLEDPPDRPADTGLSLGDLDHDRRAMVRRALVRLDPIDRRILLLTLVEGMTPREIAPIVGLQPDAVRTRKSRAIRAMTAAIRQMSRMRPWNHIAMSG